MLYTTLGMTLFGLHDADLQRACFKAYNDWIAEFCSHNPKRLIGIALISLEDIGEGAKELRRAAKTGLRGAMIWGAPPREKPYTSHEYDPFWAAAQELQMPLSLHVITGKKPPKSEEERKKVRAAARPVVCPRLHEFDSRGAALAHRHHLQRRHDALSAESRLFRPKTTPAGFRTTCTGWIMHSRNSAR